MDHGNLIQSTRKQTTKAMKNIDKWFGTASSQSDFVYVGLTLNQHTSFVLERKTLWYIWAIGTQLWT